MLCQLFSSRMNLLLSLCSFWVEYAARKTEEVSGANGGLVADSVTYDVRCHLPPSKGSAEHVLEMKEMLRRAAAAKDAAQHDGSSATKQDEE